MIYLIGGVPRAGKSILCNQLIKSLGIETYSGDALVSAFQEGFPEIGISHGNIDQSTDTMYPFLVGLVRSYVSYDCELLIEGQILSPKVISKLKKEFPKSIREVVLGYPEIKLKDKFNDVVKYSNKVDWLVKSDNNEYIKSMITGFIDDSVRLREECRDLGLVYIDVSKDFTRTLELTLRYLLSGELGQ